MPSTTKINGVVHSWQTIESTIAGLSFENLTELNYKSSLDPGMRRSRTGKVSGWTHGDEDHEGDMSLPKEDSAELIGSLGDGFGLQFFGITVSYSDGVGPIITDTLVGCRIIDVDAQNAQGNEQTIVKHGLKITDIYWGTPSGQVRMSNLGGAGPNG